MPCPTWDETRTVPRTLLHHVLHDVEPDAAAGDVGHRALRRETRQEQELQQLGLAESLGGFAVDQASRDDRRAQLLHVHAAAVVETMIWSLPAL